MSKRYLIIGGSLIEGVGQEIRQTTGHAAHEICRKATPIGHKVDEKVVRLIKNNWWDHVILQPWRYDFRESWRVPNKYGVAVNRLALSINRVHSKSEDFLLIKPWLPDPDIADQLDCDTKYGLLGDVLGFKTLHVSPSEEEMDSTGHLVSNGTRNLAHTILTRTNGHPVDKEKAA